MAKAAMPKGDPKIAALFERLLPADERTVIRLVFGHKAAFVGGNMFSGTFGKHVFVRLDASSRVELLTVAGAKPFEPMKAGGPYEKLHLVEFVTWCGISSTRAVSIHQAQVGFLAKIATDHRPCSACAWRIRSLPQRTRCGTDERMDAVTRLGAHIASLVKASRLLPARPRRVRAA